MNLQNLVEGVEQVFGESRRTQIIKEFDIAQKALCSEAGLIEESGSLSDVTSYISWSLPSSFVELNKVDFYNSDGDPLYKADLDIDFEVYDGKIHFFSRTTTPISTMPSSIAYIVLRYNRMPSDLSDINSTVDIDEVEYPAMEAHVFERMYSKFPVPIGSDREGNVIKAIDHRSLRYWGDKYYKLKIEAKKRKNSLDNTERDAVFYESAGQAYFLRRSKESSISAITIPSYTTLYSKYVRFTATSPSTLTEVLKIGYGDLSYEMDGNDIKITSSGEFGVETWGDDTQNSSHAYVDANTFTFTPEPLGDWGTTIIEIWEY